MKPALLALLTLLLSPAIARADFVYKCKAVKFSEEKTANLRFEESGRGGGIEVEYWSGYPPISLVNAELQAPNRKAGKVEFQSDLDPLWGYSAVASVPEGFLRLDFFEADITLIKGQNRNKIAFSCNRF